jgi:hypothetical protein
VNENWQKTANRCEAAAVTGLLVRWRDITAEAPAQWHQVMTYRSLSPAKAGDPVTTGFSNKCTICVYWMPRFSGA